MKTIIFSDLHLNPIKCGFEKDMVEKCLRAIDRERPESVIFNGDTFDLFFMRMWSDIPKSPAEQLHSILNVHQVWTHTVKLIPQIIFLVGEHDQSLLHHESTQTLLKEYIPRAIVSAYWQDKSSQTLIFHGNQLHYDNIACVNETLVSLTEKLTQIIEDWLLSGQSRERWIELYRNRKLSFWYQSGYHTSYIDGVSRLFGCNRKLYYARIAEFCKSALFQEWARHQSFVSNQIFANIARLSAGVFGKHIRLFAPLYWSVANAIIRRRLAHRLNTGHIDYPPHRNLQFQNLVIGHDHRAFSIKRVGRQLFCTGSPKAQSWFDGGHIQTMSDGSYIVIDNQNIEQKFLEEKQWT